MKKILLATIIATTLLAGCGPKELTAEQKEDVANLKTELAQTEKDILSATDQQSKYSGGLIKNLTTARLEILETNKALIEQRINAIQSGAKVDVKISGVKPNPEVADEIKKEIDSLNVKIDEAKKDASQYSGGLIQVLKLSTVATQEQTLAMLQQHYLSAKYGLAEVKTSNDSLSKNNQQKKDNQEAKSPSIPALEGPFGLEAGLSKKTIEEMTGIELKPIEESINLYSSTSLPKQNSDFEAYGLLISPESGLCEIRSVGKVIDNDSYGIALRSKFEELSKSLSSIYGKSDNNDFLLSGSIWKDPKYWMMSLSKKERFLTSEWKGTKENPLKSNLQSITLDARANDSESGYVFLQYTFNNSKSCEEESENSKKSSL